jgi:predicted Zn-dependent peptidase
VANDNNESLAMSIGKSFLYFDRISSTEEISERIMALSASDIMDAAALITMPRCSILTMK